MAQKRKIPNFPPSWSSRGGEEVAPLPLTFLPTTLVRELEVKASRVVAAQAVSCHWSASAVGVE